MEIRRYTEGDCEAVSRLFYETIHAVNAKDYTEAQLAAWARDAHSLTARREDLLKQYTLVAEADGAIIGFGSIDDSGYLDLLFVHKEHQREGVAKALCDELERGFPCIKTFASVTAKPFFEHRGFRVIEAREAERFGVKLKNFEMKKQSATR